MRFGFSFKAILFLAVMCLLIGPEAWAQFSSPATSLSATAVPQSDLMQATELVGMLRADGVQRPVVIQVGSLVMVSAGSYLEFGVCWAGLAAGGIDTSQKVCGAAVKKAIDCDLLRLLPVESLPEYRLSVQATARSWVHEREGALHREEFW